MSQTDFMKRKMRAGLVTATAMALIIGPFMSMAQARAKVGVASAVIPQARLGGEPGELEIISVGDRVDQDMIIETGKRGRTQVLFVDGSSMNIGPSSRIVIDDFVFDPKELQGNLGARIEKGSMRFIGGVLSKRGKQVSFNAGDATVGIRGGIAKLALEENGALRAELVHGRLSVETPQGVFETARIGTLIERDATGVVSTRTVTPEETKATLDEEAAESFVEPEAAPVAAAPGATDEPADIVDDPVEAGLVELDENGNLKATETLIESDPEAAKLIDEGAIAFDDSGNAAPTEKMLELDPTAKQMFDEGLLEVDENGFLVPSNNFDPEALYAEFQNQEASVELVSEITLAEFELEAPSELAFEAAYLEKRAAATEVFKTDNELADFYDKGLVELDAGGNIKASDNFKQVFTAALTRSTQTSFGPIPQTFIDDSGADKFLLETGIFDTKITTRVLGAERATSLYSAEVTRVVSRDIVRENTVDAITKLAVANEIKVSDDFKNQGLEKLVAVGNDLSGIDRMRAVLGADKVNTAGLSIDFTATSSFEFDSAPDASFDAGFDKGYELKTQDGAIADFSDAPALSVSELEQLNRSGVSVDKITGIFGGLNVVSTSGQTVYVSDTDLNTSGGVTNFEDLLKTSSDFGDFKPTIDSGSVAVDSTIGASEVPTSDLGASDLGTSDFSTGDFDAGDFSTGDFDAGDFSTGDFDAGDFSTGDFDTGDFSTGDFDAGDFSTGDFSTGDFDTGGFDTGSDFSNIIDGEFGNASIVPDIAIDASGAIGSIGDYSIDPNDFYIGIEDTGSLIRDTQEDVTKGSFEPVIYNLYAAGSRVSENPETIWGVSGPEGVWNAFSTLGNDKPGMLEHYPDGTVFLEYVGTTQDATGDVSNNVQFSSTGVGTVISDVLAHGNQSFSVAVAAVAGSRSNGTESFGNNSRGNVAIEQSSTRTSHVSIGLWEDSGFVDQGLGNIKYKHVGHYAIGAPLSPDTIQELAGMTAIFSGTAVGSVVSAAGREAGFGNVSVQVDYANRASADRNFWELSGFISNSGSYIQSGETRVTLSHGEEGRYYGASSSAGIAAQVDGGVHGVYKNGGVNTLETAGAFAVNDTNNNVAISGSYTAGNTNVSRSPD